MTSQHLHVRAGQKIRLKVIPQQCSEAGSVPNIELEISSSIRWLTRPHNVHEGQREAKAAFFQVNRRSRWPFPKKAEVTISTGLPGHEKVQQAIALAIWPSFWSVCCW